jgi:hypothetical protein
LRAEGGGRREEDEQQGGQALAHGSIHLLRIGELRSACQVRQAAQNFQSHYIGEMNAAAAAMKGLTEV